MHPRDRQIFALVAQLAGPAPTHAQAIAALHDAVVRVIPSGKLYLIAPGVIGSHVSKLGIDEALRVVRVRTDGSLDVLAPLRDLLRVRTARRGVDRDRAVPLPPDAQ